MSRPATRLLAHLRAEPSSGGRSLPWLDGIRGTAVLFILIRHAWGLSGQPSIVLSGFGHRAALAPWIDMMSNGIDLFFVLSAFLLSQPFIKADLDGRPPPDLRRFYRSRLLRIGPPYWTVLVVMLIVFTPSLIPPHLLYSARGATAVLAHLLFLQNSWLGSFGIWNIGTPFWTLTVEMMFYGLLPFVVPAFYGKRAFRIGVPAGLGITVAWLSLCRWSFGPLVHGVLATSMRPDRSELLGRYFLTQQIPASAFDFAIGIAAANLYVRKARGAEEGPVFEMATSRAGGTLMATAGVAVAIAAMWKLGVLAIAHQYYFGFADTDRSTGGYAYYFLNEMPYGLAFGLLIAGVAFGAPVLRRVFSASILALFGVLGYSIYLLHMPMLYLFNSFHGIAASASFTAHFVKLFSAGVVATLALSFGLYLAVERPFMMRSRAGGRIDRLRRDTLSLSTQPGPPATRPA